MCNVQCATCNLQYAMCSAMWNVMCNVLGHVMFNVMWNVMRNVMQRNGMSCHVLYECMYDKCFYIYFYLFHARLPNSVKKAQVLLVYPLILLITWAQQVPMSHEYDLLLQTFLNNEGMDEAHLHHSVAEYFKASHGTTMLAILATGGRGEFPVLKMPYSQVEKNVHNNSGGWTLVEFLLTIIDHNQQLMAILSWSIGRWDAR